MQTPLRDRGAGGDRKRLSSIRNKIILGVVALILGLQVIAAIVQSYQVNSIYLNEFKNGAESVAQVAFVPLNRMARTGHIVKPDLSEDDLSEYVNLFVQIIQQRQFEAMLRVKEDLMSISFFGRDNELIVSSARDRETFRHTNTWAGETTDQPRPTDDQLESRDVRLYRARAGVRVVVPYMYDDIRLGVMVLEFDRAKVRAALVRTILVAGGLVIVYMLAASYLMYKFITRTLTRPIREMTRLMEELAEGKLDQWYPITSMDEIGQMGQSVNDLIESLQKTFADIQVAVDGETLRRSAPNREPLASEIDRAQQELRLLSRSLVNTIEDERKKIASDLHDEVGKALTLLQCDLVLVEQSLSEHDVAQRERCTKAMSDTKALARIIRSTCSQLRPDLLEELGLSSAISSQVEAMNRQLEGIDIEFRTSDSGIRLDADTELSLYRIFQEAVNNVVKHANAAHVTVELSVGDSVASLTVEDDGVGFRTDGHDRPADPSSAGIGLLSMKERALALGGDIRISSKRHAGTRVSVEVPIRRRESCRR